MQVGFDGETHKVNSKAEARRLDRKLRGRPDPPGHHSAKQSNRRDYPDTMRRGICLVCGNRSDRCICSGHMTQRAQERYNEGQKKIPTPKQAGWK